MKTRIQYQEVTLKSVLDHFVAGFQSTPEREIERGLGYDAFVDIAQGVVIFKLYVKDQA